MTLSTLRLQLAVQVLVLYKSRRRKRRPRSSYVRPVNTLRDSHSEFATLLKPMQSVDHQWFQTYTRQTPAVWQDLLSKVGPSITHKQTHRYPVSTECRLTIGIRSWICSHCIYFENYPNIVINQQQWHVCELILNISGTSWPARTSSLWPSTFTWAGRLSEKSFSKSYRRYQLYFNRSICRIRPLKSCLMLPPVMANFGTFQIVSAVWMASIYSCVLVIIYFYSTCNIVFFCLLT